MSVILPIFKGCKMFKSNATKPMVFRNNHLTMLITKHRLFCLLINGHNIDHLQ